jgi:phosphatidate cytidylyltransferase
LKNLRQRVITAIIGLLILAVILVFYGTYAFNAAIVLLSALAVWEMAGLAVKNRKTARSGQFAAVIIFSVIIPFCFLCAILMRSDFGEAQGRYYLFMALGAAWLADTGGYFVGSKFGKHKLAPVISPKKTVEGMIGGIIAATLLMMPVTAAYIYFAGLLDVSMSADYTRILIAMPPLAVIGMLGDLCMSAIKRQFGVKDYGSIMPGHGGVLDRFDSVLFTLPAVYALVQYFPVVFLR